MPDEFVLTTAIKALYNAPPYHIALEVILLVWILKLAFFPNNDNSKGDATRKKLTAEQEQELIDEWQPEPLVPDINESSELDSKPVNSRLITGQPTPRCILNGKECINLASFNFLNFVGNKSHEERAIKAIRKYGVGSCGPRGFYGTVDVHLDLERELAEFLGVEEAILYSYGFATAASAIPAYSKRGDIIFADEQCHFAIQKGIDTSRSKVYYYEHNNMDHLKQLLTEQEERDSRNKSKAAKTRKFIVTEGVFMNTGELCDLKMLVEFKYRFKVRIFLDESISFGTMGKTGRGITEHLGVDRKKIDMIMCNLEFSIGSNGGFCAGTSYVIDHQRLAGLGYCFSASLPPLCTVASSESLKIMTEKPDLFSKLAVKSRLLQKSITNGLREKGGKYPLDPMFTPNPIEGVPIMHIYCELDQHDRDGARKLLDRLVELCEADGVAIVQAAYLWNCEVLQSRRPSIRINATIGLTDEETVYAANVIKRNSVICRREYDIQNGDEVTPQRPTSLSLRSDAGTGQLLSSPVLEARPAFPSRRVRTYSGSGNNANKRIIKTRNLSSGEESSDDANEESVSINQS